jgi:hypothetical protein
VGPFESPSRFPEWDFQRVRGDMSGNPTPNGPPREPGARWSAHLYACPVAFLAFR